MQRSSSGPRRFDVGVIGGGAVGMASAMALAREHGASVAVLEAESDLAAHQTSHNSGVIHSGLYYKPGSLKAKLCAEGRERLYRFCEERGVRHERCGKIVVATRPDELPQLDELERRGRANGLTGIRRITDEQIKDYEPDCTGIAGLWVEETGIIAYKDVVAAYGQVVREHGGEVKVSAKVRGVKRDSSDLVLETTQGEFRVRGLLNCAGLQSDRVARMCGLAPDVRIVPFRGEYYELRHERGALVRNLIYPVPDPRFPFLGVHFTRMIGGGVEAGPNAVLALARHGYRWSNVSPSDLLDMARFGGFWRMTARYWKTGFGEMHRSLSKKAFLKSLQRLVPAVRYEDLVPGGSGVRAQALGADGKMVDDFRIMSADRMVHVLNAPSPAATASMAIGSHVASIVGAALQLDGPKPMPQAPALVGV